VKFHIIEFCLKKSFEIIVILLLYILLLYGMLN
jgi:hypothetical protein